jgi:DNA-binding SARP family transcriptional activator
MTNVPKPHACLSSDPPFRVLGPLRLRGASGYAELGGAKPRRLLAALALNANRVVPIELLADVIWGDFPPRSAHQNVQTYVWSLRTAARAAGVPGTLIEARPPGYTLRTEPGDLDWLRFERLRCAGSAVASRDPAAAATLLAEALGYWHGPVVADVADDLGPLTPRVVAMEEARLCALDLRIAADLELGRHLELTGELSELAGAHPLRERFQAQYMLALYRCGRQSDALAVFHGLRRRLAEELGVDPAPEVARLYQAMLGPAGSSRGTAPTLVAGLRPYRGL